MEAPPGFSCRSSTRHGSKITVIVETGKLAVSLGASMQADHIGSPEVLSLADPDDKKIDNIGSCIDALRNHIPEAGFEAQPCSEVVLKVLKDAESVFADAGEISITEKEASATSFMQAPYFRA
jgi:hypothetical protein